MTLIGYLESLSEPAGSTLDCMISSTVGGVDVDLIRLIHGDTNPAGPGPRIEELGLPVQTVPATEQHTHPGSCVVIEDLGSHSWGTLAVSLLFQPTRPTAGQHQALIALHNADGPAVVVAIDEGGALVVHDGAGQASGHVTIEWRRGTWYRVEVEQHAIRLYEVRTRASGVYATQVASSAMYEVDDVTITSAVIGAETCERTGRAWRPTACFNGKIEAPSVRQANGGGEVVADWRFDRSLSTSRCEDVSGAGRHGVVVNAPTRGVTGHNWTHDTLDFAQAPEQYGAIHFHDDDLDDAGWDVSARVSLPPELPSGVYGDRLRAGDQTDVIPLAVTPGPTAEPARIAVLLPTFTYIAYGNERMIDRFDYEDDKLTDHEIDPGHHDRLLGEHPEWGLSLYDVHSDGSSCVYSTSRRPIPNLRPDYRAWLQNAPRHLSADLYLVDWLAHREDRFDVVTDHDLNAVGPSLLEPYDVVITGSHPEYVSATILDSLEEHLEDGGYLMYLGGNGFYWVTSQDQERPHLLEVRRGHGGTRPSEVAAGEGVHSTTGEPGGLWRHRGRSPNRLTGIGMAAQGWDDQAPGYGRMPDSHRPEAAFLFDGIDDEVIGNFGLIMDGSSGDEIDRFDPDHGSPEDTLVLARSTGHSDYYQLVGEDILATRPGVGGAECDDVRSDMTLLPHPGGGWVLSVGSICFTGAISHNGYDNNIARLLDNALEEALR